MGDNVLLYVRCGKLMKARLADLLPDTAEIHRANSACAPIGATHQIIIPIEYSLPSKRIGVDSWPYIASALMPILRCKVPCWYGPDSIEDQKDTAEMTCVRLYHELFAYLTGDDGQRKKKKNEKNPEHVMHIILESDSIASHYARSE